MSRPPSESAEAPALQRLGPCFALPVSTAYGVGSKYLYVKPHGGADWSKTNTLFVCNVPIGSTAERLTTLFSRFGRVESVELSRVGQTDGARVTFADRKSMRALFTQTAAHGCREEVYEEMECGVQQWIREAEGEHLSTAELSQAAESGLSAFEAERQRREAEEAERVEKLEAEGWHVVKRRAPTALSAPPPALSSSSAPPAKRAKKEKTNPNFYEFQVKERKRDQLNRLREQFQKDKEKIQKMREARLFKPF